MKRTKGEIWLEMLKYKQGLIFDDDLKAVKIANVIIFFGRILRFY